MSALFYLPREHGVKFIDVSTDLHPYTFAIVDSIDYARVIDGPPWACVETAKDSGLKYVQRTRYINGKGAIERIHNVILAPARGLLVDHINRNPLDNRRSNLRIARHSDNARNTKLRSDNTSGYKGVWRHGKKWAALISVNKKQLRLGSYLTAEEAAAAYDAAALQHFGEFACTNASLGLLGGA